MPLTQVSSTVFDHLKEITAVAVRSQFDCSIPVHLLAIKIVFFHAYCVTFLICESEEKSERFYLTK